MVGSTRTRRATARIGALVGMIAIATTAAPLAAGASRGGVPSLPDYVITTVNNPPAAAAPGDSFPALDTTKNQGSGDATQASQNLYYLSLDATVDGSDTIIGGRGLNPLTAGATSSGGLNAHIPAGQPLGDYYVITCADGSNNVPEVNEGNNCTTSSTQISITLPDYRITTISEPPADGQRGLAFGIDDTTKNVGKVDATATTATTYYFSKNTKFDAGDVAFGGRTLFGLAAHASSNGGLNGHVPSDLAPGQYFLLACADVGNAVAESNETNNCAHSIGRMTLTVPDYYVPSVGTPPAEAARNSEFSFGDQVRNKGGNAPFITENAYYLSKDGVVDASDVQFALAPEIPRLERGQSVFDGFSLTVPSNAKLGFFHIIVCADATNVLSEADESNNCRVTPGKVHIVASSPTVSRVRVR
jgi:CARDB